VTRDLLAVTGPRSVSMTLRDGTRLDADIWAPEAPGRYPVLLMRQPYGRRIACTVVFAHPAWYAAQGYIVAIQDVRGSGTSGGSFRLFADEEADGAAAVAWAADLPRSTGKVGMYGFSYQGNTQFLALAGGAALGALAPAMAAWTIRDDWAWEGRAFRFSGSLGWGCQMGWLKSVHDGEQEAAAAFLAASRNQPVGDAERTMPAVMRRFGHLSHYREWLINPDPGPYWEAIAPATRLAGKNVDVPMLHIGGWYDNLLTGTLGGHAAMARRSAAPQRLVIGPWTHQPWGRHVGAVDFGPAANSPIDTMQLAWFDRHLKQIDGEPFPALTLFDLGARAWRDFDGWPAAATTPLFLGGSGRAAASVTDGTLGRTAGRSGSEWFVHDPWRPVPSLGGHTGRPGGMQDRAALDDRNEVACFTSAPLDRPFILCGPVSATLWVEADQPSFDISAVLSMVSPDGRAWTLTEGYQRLDAPGMPVQLPMRTSFVTVPAGHALRLSVAGASFPAYAVNPGTGGAANAYKTAEERIITLTIRHGGATPSCLSLPVISG
jgi:uncharacterized protein